MISSIRVLIVDDSILFREALSRELRKEPYIVVAGMAGDPFEARDKIIALNPDVMTLDVQMPRMDGIEFLLRLLPQYPIPVIVSSSLEEKVFDAIAAGAVDFVPKPGPGYGGMEAYAKELALKIKEAAGANVDSHRRAIGLDRAGRGHSQPAGQAAHQAEAAHYSQPAHQAEPGYRQPQAFQGAEAACHSQPAHQAEPAHYSQPAQRVEAAPNAFHSHGAAMLHGAADGDAVIAIGASTGGTEAIFSLLTKLPADSPGIVMVQHMPPGFTALYAERLDKACAISVREAVDNDALRPGLALLAPGGDRQMKLLKGQYGYYVRLVEGEKVSGHRPSADFLFDSVATAAGAKAIGVLLTGMGADGARGLLKMRNGGAYTIGQDEASCVVYGMPMAAYNMGAVARQLPLDQIAREICGRLSLNHMAAKNKF
ncbi:MAG: chemotaxis response regulator protein-glutamate methylesterase [Clostridiales Family XIII bacterium]|jgi:two-component system chemotaxis response regulator CheB|nr:chemotaxis response regulator protein-glutamate methylesterase [Clostridiales Family XIII bacterium]